MIPSMTRRIYTVGGDTGYTNWMEATKLVDRMDDADLVCFTGGEDVDPSIYGQPRNPTTGSNLRRDLRENEEWHHALVRGLPMIGICRGSQWLCAKNGGILVQNQRNPSFMHPMLTSDGRTFDVSSTHHQSVYPWRLSPELFKVLGWTVGLCGKHEGGNCEELVTGVVPGDKECEIVYYPKTRSLGIQSHPEMVYDGEATPMITYMRSLLDALMAGTL